MVLAFFSSTMLLSAPARALREPVRRLGDRVVRVGVDPGQPPRRARAAATHGTVAVVELAGFMRSVNRRTTEMSTSLTLNVSVSVGMLLR